MTDLSKFLIKRTGHGVLVIWAALTIIFMLRFLAPGSPVNAIVPPEVGPEIRQQIIRDLGLHKPMHVQYFEYLRSLIVERSLGYSYVSRTSVWDLIAGRINATIELGVVAMAIAIVLSIPLGVVSALRRHQPVDYAATVFSLLGISTPNFWLALMMVLLLSVHFNVFPTSGRPIGFIAAMEMLIMQFDTSGLTNWLAHILLPALTLGTYFTALITRLTRSELLDELGEGYVRVLEAKGIPETLITFKHVLRNSLIPVVTVVGLQLGHLINGSVVTEVVFDWPGMGTLLITAINQRDWTLIQGTLVLIAVGWVVLNIAVDLLYTLIDPKVEIE